MTTHDTLNLLDKTAAYWYACSYNDHRQPETERPQPYVDPMGFATYWVSVISDGKSRPSLQDAFKAFAAQVTA